jgi:nucleotide-binding universal stress UspA family protein
VKKMGGRDIWYVEAAADMLAAGREELRKAFAEVVREALARGWVETGEAEGWMEKLEEGRVLKEGWPKYKVRVVEGALVVSFGSTSPDNIEREAQRFREMGLEEGRHFTVKMPKGGKKGYVNILRKGLEHIAWLSVHSSEDQRKLAAEFVKYILQRAEEKGEDVRKKVEEVVEEGDVEEIPSAGGL